ncbi:hypothetical protein [Variovorax sp. WDL1]|uniref:hypothetical protein n=1 Tax=Variovorax sp. WDL1 TaxID=207745 RepID=UPI001E392C6A|nr:hypothetical protein [Variovorax sp. WDL1]
MIIGMTIFFRLLSKSGCFSLTKVSVVEIACCSTAFNSNPRVLAHGAIIRKPLAAKTILIGKSICLTSSRLSSGFSADVRRRKRGAIAEAEPSIELAPHPASPEVEAKGRRDIEFL